MLLKKITLLFLCLLFKVSLAQLPVARDTIPVIENGYILKMPWANGINFSNVSNVDLNADGKKDLVAFDRLNVYGVGRFRCFINTGSSGQLKYKESWYHSYLFPQVANWAVLKDYNCDGKEDLFCSVNLGISVYKNISTSTSFGFQLVKTLLLSNYNPAGTPSITNLYASTIGVPGIVDVDGDGDLDVLTFSPQGVFIQYHKNMSVENNYNCDSLIYEYHDNCWGRISESNCQVNFNVCETARDSVIHITPKTYHAGSCLTCIDPDSDNDWDLLMGDILCNSTQFVYNTGTHTNASFSDTTMLYPNYPAKSNTQQIEMNSFPCAYSIDANGDGRKDLIATPNSYGTENYKSVWLYLNTSSTPTANFQFVKNNFLQDEMIEVGQNSFPVLFDYNNDGLKDLLIGNYGYYNNLRLNARLALYANIGSKAQPIFSLITRDLGSLSTRTLAGSLPINNAMPTVGDVDSDGDLDILFGTSSGQIHWLENTAGSGQVCNFSAFHENPFSITTLYAAAAPQLYDIDNDTRLDLLIGMQNGKIAYYKNTATGAMSTFSLITNTLGNVDVKGDPNLYGYDGYAVPFFYRDAITNTTHLLVGSFSGAIFEYNVPSAITNSFALVNNSVNNINEGSQSAVWYEDINNDTKPDLFIGNGGGGLNFFSSRSQYVGIQEYAPDPAASVLLFPNPANTDLNIQVNLPDFKRADVSIYDLLGKEALQTSLASPSGNLDVSALSKGVYFVNINVQSNSQYLRVTRKIIKE